MKRIILLSLMVVMATLSANAQIEDADALACISDCVELKSGPGSNYPCLLSKESKQRKLQLFKPTTIRSRSENYNAGVKIINYVEYAGKQKKGYLYVFGTYDLDNGAGETTMGWVEAKYLRLACDECDGRGTELFERTICDKCKGRGY